MRKIGTINKSASHIVPVSVSPTFWRAFIIFVLGASGGCFAVKVLLTLFRILIIKTPNLDWEFNKVYLP